MAERDPRGLDLNTPGAKADADKHRPHLVFAGFARALEAVSEVGTEGAKKYSDYGHYKVPNGVERYTNAMQRHYLAECKGAVVDPKSGFMHAAHTAWNALARLELMLKDLEDNRDFHLGFDEELHSRMSEALEAEFGPAKNGVVTIPTVAIPERIVYAHMGNGVPMPETFPLPERL